MAGMVSTDGKVFISPIHDKTTMKELKNTIHGIKGVKRLNSPNKKQEDQLALLVPGILEGR
tara:strand:- start:702 stop:884 length:183 start_codon:yes stop_codon:yes gene_type:complete